jgi:hypothetical protein
MVAQQRYARLTEESEEAMTDLTIEQAAQFVKGIELTDADYRQIAHIITCERGFGIERTPAEIVRMGLDIIEDMCHAAIVARETKNIYKTLEARAVEADIDDKQRPERFDIADQ